MTLPGNSAGFALLWRSTWRYARQRPWQTGLNVLGIMIGVMMVVAVDLANNSARRAFDASIDILNGAISHQIVGGSDGVPDRVFTRLKTELGLVRAAPTLSGRVTVGDRELTLIGMDLISEGGLKRNRPGLPGDTPVLEGGFLSLLGTTNRVAMASDLAAALGLATGDRFSVGTVAGDRAVTLVSTFPSRGGAENGDILVADIAAAQTLLARPGRLDSIDLVLDDDEAARVTRWLPASLALVSAQSRNDNVRQMSEAFHVNLLAMSLLSLLVAGLLIYNTVTLAVIQRQQTLGIFRAEGVTGAQVFVLVMLENGLAGLVASLAGVAAGYALGRFLVTMVTATVDALYFDLSVTAFQVDPRVLLKGLALGVGLSLVSAFLPAWQAANSRPVNLQHQAGRGADWARRTPWLALVGLVLLAAGWLAMSPAYGSLVTGFVALTLMVFGYCLLVPLCLYLLLGLGLAVSGPWSRLSGIMALRNARAAINRSALAVAALSVAVSVTVGVGVMVGSFRGTVILWLDQSLPGDIQVTAVSGPALAQGIPDTLRARIAGLDGISALHDSVLGQVESEFGPVRLGVNDIPAEDKFYLQAVAENGTAAFNAGRGVFVSEPLAYLQHLAIGDDIRLLTADGMTAFPVLGIFHDYTSGSGLVHMHESLYGRYWPGQRFSRLTLDIAPGYLADDLRRRLETMLGGADSVYTVVSNGQLRALTLRIFDRTFAITGVLRILAILVAFVGVVSTLMALQLEKGREFAILRATGMTPGQVAGLILKQTTVLGLCAGLLALPLGLLMSDILIDVINRRSFGWSMQHFLPESVLTQGFLLAVFAAVLAGLYPAWRAGRIRPAVALREE